MYSKGDSTLPCGVPIDSAAYPHPLRSAHEEVKVTLLNMFCFVCLFFLKYFLGRFAFNVQVSGERQETGGREEGMTCRIGPLGAGFGYACM